MLMFGERHWAHVPGHWSAGVGNKVGHLGHLPGDRLSKRDASADPVVRESRRNRDLAALDAGNGRASLDGFNLLLPFAALAVRQYAFAKLCR